MKNIDLHLFHLFTLFLINLQINETAIIQYYFILSTYNYKSIHFKNNEGGWICY